MSENDWERMLRAVFGDEAAERIIASMKEQGIDPEAALPAGFNPAQMPLIINQMRTMLGSAGDGPVNWQVGEQVARQQVVQQGSTTVSGETGQEVRAALQTASLWLDPVTEISPVTGPVQAWSRLDWVAHSLPTFRKLTDPVGANIGRAFSEAMTHQLEEAPEELRSLLGADPARMLSGITASLLGVQYGAGLAGLADVTFGTSDAGLPLVEGETAALVPSNVAAWGEGLDVEEGEVLLYAATREQAAARLYSTVPWLRPSVLDSVAGYAADITIDTSAIEDQVRSMNLDPSALAQGEVPEIDLSEVFSPEPTEEQQRTLRRLEHMISMVEGWVTAISAQAVAAHLPHAVPLAEMFTRRSVTDAPATRVFGPLVGFELAPKSVRAATAFWNEATRRLGAAGRDALWRHPDLLPQPEQLENPESFFTKPEPTELDQELDSFLDELLSGNGENDAPHEPGFGEAGDDKPDGEADGAGDR